MADSAQAYDYIITGAGLAGLSLVMHLLENPLFDTKKILLVDADAKKTNDRTWCFWEKMPELFQPIVKKEWQHLWFHGHGFSKKMDLAPYTYKLIRGIDFYTYCFDRISRQPNITFLQAKVEDVFSDGARGTGIVAGGETYRATYVFNSILLQKPILKHNQYWLLQHFKGWTIETEAPFFKADEGTLMDFRTSQAEGTTFFYVLPLSPTKALVEYTFFSKNVLPDAVYDAALKNYIAQTLHLAQYTVTESEFGVIPMTNYPFSKGEGKIINIGTAGGYTKASSGYTFQFIQKASRQITAELARPAPSFSKPHTPVRFPFYDSVLLHILYHNTLGGGAIFTDLFRKNKARQVLKFLDNETTLPEELRLISSLPTLPFSKAALQQLSPFG